MTARLHFLQAVAVFACAAACGLYGQVTTAMLRDIRADKGLASDHAPHRFVTSYIYEFPFGRGKPWLSTSAPVVDAILGGWQVAGLVTLMSGMPESALESANQANVDSGARRPDRVCNGDLGSARTLTRWFDTSCYVLQPLYQYGNAGRDTIIGPGLVDFDLNFSKEFKIKENKRLQFRSEFFNIMNTPYFAKPISTLGAPTFGQVTGLARGGTANTRIIQFALKLTY